MAHLEQRWMDGVDKRVSDGVEFLVLCPIVQQPFWSGLGHNEYWLGRSNAEGTHGVGEFSVRHKIAVVTGANKGIGLEISKQLASKGVGVVLTARDVKRGTEAAESPKGLWFLRCSLPSARCNCPN
ncbi:hypothetical protein J5N97_001907 [Dioscorea zingiberensis]|uniref:Uncharacterized protein n=1 Tax=Dioscorea zingiberensis TaxID=325984 RepID=A0A9D5BTD3_9LILI|nr:hypothetical protein J5N97_001907 [Dioscorea zingiberensis]